MTQYLFRNVELLDPAQDRLVGGREVLVEDELIREVSDRPIVAAGAGSPFVRRCHVVPPSVDRYTPDPTPP